MWSKNNLAVYLILCLVAMSLYSCKGKKKAKGTVNIYEMTDPDMLNPINTKTAGGDMLCKRLLFQNLAGLDPSNYSYTSQLMKDYPVISSFSNDEVKDGERLDYEIRPEAVWDNGTPITGHDYVFTIKCLLNPKTNCEHLKPYFDWVYDIQVDPTNPKKFSVFSNKKYYIIEETAGSYIIPEYNYDPNHIMKKFSIKDMNTQAKRDALKENTDILAFAESFNSEKYSRDPNYVVGSGPYRLEKWVTGQELVFKRKDTWWGDKFAELRDFWAYPERIKLKIIPDPNTAITALKNKQLDMMINIPSKAFKELEADENFKKEYNLAKADRLGYSYFAFNLRKDKFKDIRVRKAIAHAINRDKLIEVVSLGDAIKTESFVHPTQLHYNKDLKEYAFDIELAASLLDEAGWVDSDGDGIRDKVINGQKEPLEINFKYPKTEAAKNMALIIQQDMKKLGVKWELVEREFPVMVQDLNKLDFDMVASATSIPPTFGDPKQIWHSSSAVPGGSNRSGWSSPEGDKIMEEIEVELDAEKRKNLAIRLQQLIHDDVPVIFYNCPRGRVAISNKIKAQPTAIPPGYFYNELQIGN